MSIVLHITWRKLLFHTTPPPPSSVCIIYAESSSINTAGKMIKVSRAPENNNHLHLPPLHCQYLICILFTEKFTARAAPFKIQSLLPAKTTPWMYFLWCERDWTGTAVVLIFLFPPEQICIFRHQNAPLPAAVRSETVNLALLGELQIAARCVMRYGALYCGADPSRWHQRKKFNLPERAYPHWGWASWQHSLPARCKVQIWFRVVVTATSTRFTIILFACFLTFADLLTTRLEHFSGFIKK